jgi:hypothetical protein
MERIDGDQEAQESPRCSAWKVRRAGAQRGQATGKSRKRTQGRVGQKSQEETCGPAQRAATSAWAAKARVESVIALVRARFGDLTIGLGDRGIRYQNPLGSGGRSQPG